MAIKTTLTPTEHAATLDALETIRNIDVETLGALTVSVLARRRITEKGIIRPFYASLAVGGTVTDNIIEFRKNGAVFAAAITMPHAQTDPTSYLVTPTSDTLATVQPGDLIEVVATQVATAASGLCASIPVARRYDAS